MSDRNAPPAAADSLFGPLVSPRGELFISLITGTLFHRRSGGRVALAVGVAGGRRAAGVAVGLRMLGLDVGLGALVLGLGFLLARALLAALHVIAAFLGHVVLAFGLGLLDL